VTEMTKVVLAATRWPTNGHLIADVARLGYLDGSVLDVTYGLGTFWREWQPTNLVGTDLDPAKSPRGCSADVRFLPFVAGSFDAVVFDPPYKLNGTPTATLDGRYGVDVPATWQERHELIRSGITECLRVTRRYLLVKCMDQVCSGAKRWQTMEFTRHAEDHGARLVDRFDLLVTPRPQPAGRRQVHAQGNYSTLLVFESRKEDA